MNKSNKISVRIILLAGLLVGSLDILAAFTDYYIATGKGPGGVLKYIASGVFGMDAFNGGTGMMVLGLLFHFIIAFGFTVFYFLLYPRVKFVSAQPILFAIIYGIFMWAVTTKLVMPLSNVPKGSSYEFHFWKVAKAIGILICMICVPLTLIARRHFKKQGQYEAKNTKY